MYISSGTKKKMATCAAACTAAVCVLYGAWSVSDREEPSAAAAVAGKETSFAAGLGADTPVLTVGTRVFTYEEYSYYLKREKNATDGGDSSYWTDSAPAESSAQGSGPGAAAAAADARITEKELEDTVLNRLKNIAALGELAAQYGTAATDEETQKAYSDMAAEYGTDAMKKTIAENGMTEKLYLKILGTSVTERKTFAAMFGDEVLADAAKADGGKNGYAAGYMRLLITYGDTAASAASASGTGTQVSGAKKLTAAEAEKLADAVAERAAGGEDFASLVREYGEDADFSSGKPEYVKKDGLAEPENTELFSLSPGQCTAAVPCSGGYEILYRTEVPDSYIKENAEDFADSEMWTRYSKVLSEKADTLAVKTEDCYETAFANVFAGINLPKADFTDTVSGNSLTESTQTPGTSDTAGISETAASPEAGTASSSSGTGTSAAAAQSTAENASAAGTGKTAAAGTEAKTGTKNGAGTKTKTKTAAEAK